MYICVVIFLLQESQLSSHVLPSKSPKSKCHLYVAFLQKFPLHNGEKSWKVKEGKVPDLHRALSSSILFSGFLSLV